MKGSSFGERRAAANWTYGREAATGPHLHLQSDKKINLGKYEPVFLAFFAVTSLWRRRYPLF
jgi:hypothetical protein